MKMNKKLFFQSALATAVTLASIQASAVPFAPTDARAMAMGGTGVASARTVHAVQFNPSLLSTAKEEDDFGLLLPQIGGYVSDEDDFIDNSEDFADADHADKFNDAVKGIEAPLDAIQADLAAIDAADGLGDAARLTAIQNATTSLDANTIQLVAGTNALDLARIGLSDGLASLSNRALRGGIGGGAGLAIPSKKFSAALSFNSNVTFSGKLNVSEADLNVLGAYTQATKAYADTLAAFTGASQEVADILDNITNGDASRAGELTAANTALNTAETNLDSFQYGTTGGTSGNDIFTGGELAGGADNITLSSTVEIIAVSISEAALSFSREFNFKGHDVAIGLTPKLQRIDVYDYVISVEDDVEGDDISDFGVDKTGFNLDIGASTQFGHENRGHLGIVAKNLLSQKLTSINGNTVEISPQLRAGVAYEAWGWVNLAADLDLMENDPIAFEDGTQFLGLGAEADVLGFMQVRLGFRTNLAAGKQEVISGGLGLSPFGLFHLDIGAYANASDPANEAGIVFEAGVDW
jgi:hypothetical protein